MATYDQRRIVSWIAHHVHKGLDLERILALNATRKARFKEGELRELYTEGCQCVRNAELCQQELDRRRAVREEAAMKGEPPPVFPPLRLCDIAGCKFPLVRKGER